MAKTLSLNVSTGKAGGYTCFYLLSFSGRARVSGLVATYRFSTIDTDGIAHWGGAHYAGGRIKANGLGSITQSVDISSGGGAARVSDFEFELLNQDEFFQAAFDAIDFENQPVSLHICFDDPDNTLFASGGYRPSITNALPLFNGVIKEIEWAYETVKFRCIDHHMAVHRELPSRALTREDFPNLPEGLIGQPVPIQYGDMGGMGEQLHKRLVAYMGYPGYYHPGDFTRTYCLGKCHNENEENLLLIAGHPIHQIRRFPAYALESPMVQYDDSCEGYYVLVAEGRSQLFEEGLTLVPILSVNETHDSYIIPIVNGLDESGNEKNAVDEDPANWTVINSQYGAEYIFREIDNCDFIRGALTIQYVHQGINSSPLRLAILYRGAVTGYLYVSSGSHIVVLAIRRDGGSIVFGPTQFADEDFSFGKVSLRFYLESPQHGEWWFRNLFIRLERKTTVGDTVLSAIAGRKCGESGSWGASRGITTGTLIENPAHIVESLLRDELGQQTAQIRTASFDNIAGTYRAGWLFAGGMHEVKTSFEWIGGICREAGLIYSMDYQGKHCLNAIRNSTATITIDQGGIQAELSGEFKTSFRIKQRLLNEVYNEFYLHYKRNYATDKCEGLIFVKDPQIENYNPDLTNLINLPPGTAQTYWEKCRSIYQRYAGHRQRLEWECDWIRDEDTANWLIKWLINYFTYRPLVVSLKTFLNSLDVELGDYRQLDHPLLPDSRGTANFLVTLIRIDPKSDSIELELQEMPSDLS